MLALRLVERSAPAVLTPSAASAWSRFVAVVQTVRFSPSTVKLTWRANCTATRVPSATFAEGSGATMSRLVTSMPSSCSSSPTVPAVVVIVVGWPSTDIVTSLCRAA